MTTIYMTVTVRERACTITVLAVLVATRTNESRGKGWMSVRTEQEEKPAKHKKTFILSISEVVLQGADEAV